MTTPDRRRDAELVTAARAGDQAAFAPLIQRHYPMVRAMCARALGDGDQARDVAQEAAVAAMLGLGRLRHDDRFGAWLAGIALNLCRRLLRDRDWAVFSLDAMLERRDLGEPADGGPGPADAAQAAEAAARVRAAVTALPAGQRAAAEAYYLTGLTQAEAADHLGIGVAAVKTRLHKARAALRASLADYQPERRTAMTTPTGQLVPVNISGVYLRREGDQPEAARSLHFILLTEASGERRMWIGVGKAEATALAFSLSGTELPRPMTYQFTAALLAAAGGRLREVRISSLADQVYFGQAILTSGTSVDARPSDALNLAVISDAPVYVADGLLGTDDSPPAGTFARDWSEVKIEPYKPGAAGFGAAGP